MGSNVSDWLSSSGEGLPFGLIAVYECIFFRTIYRVDFWLVGFARANAFESRGSGDDDIEPLVLGAQKILERKCLECALPVLAIIGFDISPKGGVVVRVVLVRCLFHYLHGDVPSLRPPRDKPTYVVLSLRWPYLLSLQN